MVRYFKYDYTGNHSITTNRLIIETMCVSTDRQTDMQSQFSVFLQTDNPNAVCIFTTADELGDFDRNLC